MTQTILYALIGINVLTFTVYGIDTHRQDDAVALDSASLRLLTASITMATLQAWLELVVSILMIAYLVGNNLGQWQDYVFGPLIMLVCFGMLQKTMTLMVGINYSDMPKMVKRQWSGK